MTSFSRTLLALAALASLSAHAQSNVSLYGRLDVSVNALRFSGPNAASVTTVSSDTSYWGLRGVEDLGGGHSAYFKLESQFQADTGVQGNATTLFNRESYVGLRSARLGSLALGAQYTPHIWLTGKVDPFSRGYLGHIANLFQGAPRGYQPLMNNALQYTTPVLGGFTGRVMAGARESGLGTTHGAGLEYAAGPLVLGVSYDALNVTAASVGLPGAQPSVRSRTVGLGASYDFKVVRLMGYYQTNDAQRLARVNGWMLGAIVPVGAQGAIRVGYSANELSTTGEARQLALGYTHLLSKRTSVYTTLARTRNEGTTASLWPGRQDLAGRGLPAAGQDVSGFQVGVRHLF
jgi:predicted porin